ncbi:MAG: tetratricopeptide repeat protein [Candidatus Obscuribacterales bacterium]|nr:tetratricopeptide repeat protein [Candidatus Obscuribacterales bacterium]
MKSGIIFLQIVLSLSVLTESASCAPAGTLDAMKHAEQLFNASKFDDAANWYKTELTKNPKNSTAHYMLGVALSKLNRQSEAIQEFKLAKEYDKTGTISGYSDQYIQSMMRPNTRSSKSVSPPDSPKNSSPVLEDSGDASSKKDGTTHAAEHIGKATTSASAALEAECDKEVERINKDANQKIQGLTARAERSLAEVPHYRYSGSAYQDQAIKAEYQQAVKYVRDEAARKEAEIKAHYRLKQTALEDSAYAMHKSYESKNQAGKIILSPVGTNMNIRNYQTADEPSGNDVPVVAAPAKLLPAKKH